MVNRRYILGTVLAVGLLCQHALAAIDASVNKAHFDRNEPIELTLDISDVAPGSGLDLSALQQHFNVLGTSQQQRTQLINGNRQSRHELILTLMAKNAGQVQIPAISIGQDSTLPIELTISTQSAAAQSGSGQLSTDGKLFMQAELSSQDPYVQQQLLYKVKLYRQVNLYQPQLQPPQVIAGDAIVEAVGEPTEYSSQINGQRYQVYEMHYAVTPQQSGELALSPATLIAQVDGQSSRRRRFGGSLFDAPFFSSSGFGASSLLSAFDRQQVQVSAEPVTLEVKAIPASFSGNDWLPAQALTLSSSLNQQQVQAGEPVTRTITLTAQGLAASQLPNLYLPPVAGVKQYAGQPQTRTYWQGDKLVSEATTEVTVIPSQGGQLTLPPISLKWWNVQQNRVETATLEDIQLQVAGTVPVDVPHVAANSQVQTNQGVEQPLAQFDKLQQQLPGLWQQYRQWIIALTSTALLMLAGWLLLSRRKAKSVPENHSPSVPLEPQQVGVKALLKAVSRACDRNDASKTRTALIALGEQLFPEIKLLNLNKLQKVLDPASAEAIEYMNNCLYCNQAHQWRGEALKTAITAFVKQQQKQNPVRQSNQLAPLYLGN